MISSRRRSYGTFGACWADTTTVSTRTGLPSAYRTLTWDLPSGRRYGSFPSRRTWDRRRTKPWASEIGAGMSSGVSLHAYPNMRPWSPAPSLSVPWSTPWAMFGDCLWTETITPQVSQSKPYLARVYPTSRTV